MATEIPIAHALDIAEFLLRPAAITLFKALQERRPSMKGANFEERSINSGIAEGWELCMAEIEKIAHERNQPVDLGQDKLINPSLEDDRDPSKRPSL